MTTSQVGQIGGDSQESLPFNILIIKDILDKAYGEDNVDIVKIYTGDESYLYRVIILMPLVVVTNTYGETHIIKDLFVGIVLDTDGTLYNGQFYLNRGTLTYAEYKSGYSFSHSHRETIYPNIVAKILYTDTKDIKNHTYDDTRINKVTGWAKCCLGSGEINQTLSILTATFDPIMWQLFVCQLNSYVGFEDNIGGPYQSISYLSDRGESLSVSRPSYFEGVSSDCKESYEILQWMISNVKFSLNVTNGFIEPVIMTKLDVIEDYIYKVCKKNPSSSDVFVYKDNLNHYYSDNIAPAQLNITEDYILPFSFKDKEVTVSIIPPESPTPLVETIHPKITYKYVKAYLTYICLKLSKTTLFNL